MSKQRQHIIQEAMHFNNAAVSLLALDAPSQAFQTFKLAVGGILHGELYPPLDQYHDKEMLGMGKASPKITGAKIPFSCPSEMQQMTRVQSVAIPNFKAKQSGNFVYNRAIAFNPVKNGPIFTPILDNDAFYCAVIMFNLAITIHLGHNSQCNQDKSLNKALHIYALVLSLLDEVETTSSDPLAPRFVSSGCVALKIATLNNRSQIYYELCRFKEAHNTLAILMSHVTSPINNVFSTFDQEETEGILLNLLLLNDHPSAPSA